MPHTLKKKKLKFSNSPNNRRMGVREWAINTFRQATIEEVKGVPVIVLNYLQFRLKLGSRLFRLLWFQKSRKFDSRAPHFRVTNLGSNGQNLKNSDFVPLYRNSIIFQAKIRYLNHEATNLAFFDRISLH